MEQYTYKTTLTDGQIRAMLNEERWLLAYEKLPTLSCLCPGDYLVAAAKKGHQSARIYRGFDGNLYARILTPLF